MSIRHRTAYKKRKLEGRRNKKGGWSKVLCGGGIGEGREGGERDRGSDEHGREGGWNDKEQGI